MEKYTILSMERSIVQPDMIDVELGQGGHFVKCLRVPGRFKNVKVGAECVMHNAMMGEPVAYCFGDEMHIVNAPENKDDARFMIYNFARMRHGSLDGFRFYMAMRAALKNSGVRASISGVRNLMTLARIQQNMRGK